MNPISPERTRRVDVDEDWSDLAAEFMVRKDTTYLNHGSFGISSRPVRAARMAWIERTDCQPMNTFVREHESSWLAARSKLAEFVGTNAENLVFADNATFAMNIVADSFPLAAGDEVLSNNHEYGAVHRIWDRACRRHDAKLVIATLPNRLESHEQVVDAIFAPATDQTKLLIISHITSPTALIMPVDLICAEAHRRGIAVCVDGPHAPAHVPLDLEELDCDFYTASCHKWLAATLGTGFLYVHPRWHERIEPQQLSWGRLLPNLPERWFEEFIWPGTRDFSGLLCIPVAIEFMNSVGVDAFQSRVRAMTAETTRQLTGLTGQQAIGTDTALWYGAMSHVPLPEGDWSHLQQWLWDERRIEVPIINFESRWFVRVSHHLYTMRSDVDYLIDALRTRFN